jgi:hypothetical protein
MFLCIKLYSSLLALKRAQDHQKQSLDAQVIAVFILVFLPILEGQKKSVLGHL